MVVNLAVMIGTGWTDKNTAPFVFYDLMSEGWKMKSFLTMGKAFQLLFAQLAKYDAPDLQIQVNVMSTI